MQMTTVRETDWGLIAETDMTVRLNFFSDTNLQQALSEMEILDLDTMRVEGTDIVVGGSEFTDLQEPIMAIVDAWGGSIDY